MIRRPYEYDMYDFIRSFFYYYEINHFIAYFDQFENKLADYAFNVSTYLCLHSVAELKIFPSR